MKFRQHPQRTGHEHFAGALGNTSAFHFVVAFGISRFVWDVADGSVRQFDIVGVGKG